MNEISLGYEAFDFGTSRPVPDEQESKTLVVAQSIDRLQDFVEPVGDSGVPGVRYYCPIAKIEILR